MKTHFLITIFLHLIATNVFCQELTKITGYIPEARDSAVKVQLYINNPTVLKTNKQKLLEAITNEGYFSFNFELDKPSTIVLNVNGENIFYPGVFHTLIEPFDSVNFHIAHLKKLGLMNIKVTGKGSEKVDFVKAIFLATQAVTKMQPTYDSQSIESKFQATDQKLNAIDSVFKYFKENIEPHAKDILRAYQYHYTMDIPFIAATRSESDSLEYFFEKYIIMKNRMNVLIKPDIINYYPHHVLSNYVLLSAFRNPSKEIELNYIKYNPSEYAHLIVKHFANNVPVKEYMLASLTIRLLKTEMLSDNAKTLYNFYVKNVSPKSVFYKEVEDLYNYTSCKLAPGTAFFKFELPDRTGQIQKLTDYKGKVIILDFWFYGCIGCAQMSKALDSLEGRFSKDKIEFISVNIDTKKNWLAGIGKYSSVNTIHLYTNEQGSEHPLIKFLNFSTYPKLVVIDKYGNIVGTPPDPRSKKEEFVEFVNSL